MDHREQSLYHLRWAGNSRGRSEVLTVHLKQGLSLLDEKIERLETEVQELRKIAGAAQAYVEGNDSLPFWDMTLYTQLSSAVREWSNTQSLI